MSEETEYSLPTEVVQAAVVYVREKYGLEKDLEQTPLIDLFRRIGLNQKGLKSLMKDDPSVRVSVEFDVCRDAVLELAFPGSVPEDVVRLVHASAMNKILSGLRNRNKRKRAQRKRRTKTERERSQDQIQLDKDGKQYRYRFSKSK